MDYLTLAIATGRTANRAMDFLEKSGIEFPDYHNNRRKLVIYDTTGTIKLIFAKTADLSTYVEKGAADVGIVGKDTIMEEKPDVYEMLDFGFGKCKLAVAGFPDQSLTEGKTLTIASKYPTVTEAYFSEKGQKVDTIKLNGSVELAPLIGLSDVIVDIVETGTTLKQNGLEVLEDVATVSARLIVNKASYATKTDQVQSFIDKLKTGLEGS